MRSLVPAARPARVVVLLLGALALPGAAAAQGLFPVSSVGMGEELTCLGMSHRDPSFVLVGTANGTVRRTLDGGSTWEELLVSPSREVPFGRQRQENPAAQILAPPAGKSASFMNLLAGKGVVSAPSYRYQSFHAKADKPVDVRWIEVDWHDDRRIFVGTDDGLYLSRDKGGTFLRIFRGQSTVHERVVNTVAVDPSSPRRVLLGTASGMFVSRDGGVTFTKKTDFMLVDAYVREIWFDPERPDLIHVAMAGSAMASPDGGKHWITTHWTDDAGRSDVQSLSLGPENLRLIGTRDGVFASWQGGEMGSWRRRGLRFVGATMSKVLATRDPQIWYATTDQGLWLTENSGLDWRKVLQTSPTDGPRGLISFRGERRHLWLITSREVFRAGHPPARSRYDLSLRAGPDLLRVPGLSEMVERVLRHHGISFTQHHEYRDRSAWAALIPTVSVGATYNPKRSIVIRNSFMYPSAAFEQLWVPNQAGIQWDAVATWDLSKLIFSREQLPFVDRVAHSAMNTRQELMKRISQLYYEYRRVARILVYAPPADALVREYHQIRLQEISAYLDAVSGGFWSEATSQQAGGPS